MQSQVVQQELYCDNDICCSMNAHETSETTTTHNFTTSMCYSQTDIIVTIDTQYQCMLALESSTCPDEFEEDKLIYGSKITIYITDLPTTIQFYNNNNESYFIFYIFQPNTLQCRELFRFEKVEAHQTSIGFENVYIDFCDAMDILTGKSELRMIHGSHNQPMPSVDLRTRIAYK